MLKIGHRGAKGYVAENTLASFQKAIDLGCAGIELDVHLSIEGEVVVIHDESVDRTTSGNGLVSCYTTFELGLLGIPMLDEVLDEIERKCFVNIEIKVANAVDPVLKLIEYYISKCGYKYTDFIISSFDWNALQQVRFFNDEIQIGVLTSTDLDLAFAFAKFIKAKTINPYFHLLNEENVAKIQEKGFEIHTWTVNEIEDIEKMKSLKVDGIISDFPDRI